MMGADYPGDYKTWTADNQGVRKKPTLLPGHQRRFRFIRQRPVVGRYQLKRRASRKPLASLSLKRNASK